MKFFHLSDLHIGLKLINRDLREDQEYIFDKIVRLALQETPDAVVIAGDIYDKAVPAAEAVEVFDHFLSNLREAVPQAEIMMISGNHDSGPRVNCFRSLLSRQKVHMIGLPPQGPEEKMARVQLHDSYGTVNFYLLPFVRPSMVRQVVGTDEHGNNFSYDETVRRMVDREEVDTSQRNVLVSHQFYLPAGKRADEISRMDSEIRTVGNIDQVSADVLKDFDYAALGHIHKPMTAGREYFRYCGTPMAVSVSEAGQKKGIIMAELREKGDIRIQVLPLKPLRQIRVIRGNLEEVLAQGSADFVSVVLEGKVQEDADLQERIRRAFPYLLEVRREHETRADYAAAERTGEEMDPFALCCAFLKDLDDEDRGLLKDVVEHVQEVR